MSVDGFIAGPDQSAENPLGVGGTRLHEWVFPLAEWRSRHGLDGGEDNESNEVVEASMANIGRRWSARGGQPMAGTSRWRAEQRSHSNILPPGWLTRC
jgi:hypothetical protein